MKYEKTIKLIEDRINELFYNRPATEENINEQSELVEVKDMLIEKRKLANV